MALPSVIIFSDGSCLGNPGPGGWAARLSYKNAVKCLSGGFSLTTNNRMELYAALMGLSALTQKCTVALYSDSQYLCNAIEKGWLRSWKVKNWKKKDGKAVLNRDLWERLDYELNRHAVRFFWVKGHAGQSENELVDELARQAASGTDLPIDQGFVQTL